MKSSTVYLVLVVLCVSFNNAHSISDWINFFLSGGSDEYSDSESSEIDDVVTLNETTLRKLIIELCRNLTTEQPNVTNPPLTTEAPTTKKPEYIMPPSDTKPDDITADQGGETAPVAE